MKRLPPGFILRRLRERAVDLSALALVVFAVAFQQRQLYGVLRDARPIGDHAIFEVNVRLALEGLQHVGPYSQGFHQPGPAYFYWLAVPYVVSGGTTYSLYAGAYALTVLFIAGSAVALSRWTSSLAATAAFVPLVVLELAYLGDYPLFEYWPPYLMFLGYALFLLLAGGLAAGRLAALVPLLAVASLLVQTHVTYVVPVLSGTGLAGAVLWLHHRQALRRSRCVIGFALSVVVLLWALPLYAELFSGTENLRRIYRTFTRDPAIHWQASSLFDRVALEFTGPFQYAFFGDRFSAPEAPKHYAAARVLCAGQCLALVLGWRGARARKDRYVEALCSMCLLSLPVAALVLIGIRGNVAPHHTAWISALGLVATLAAMAGLVPTRSVPALLKRQDVRLLGLAGAFLLVAVVRPIAIIPQFHKNPDVLVLADAAVDLAERAPLEPLTVTWSEAGRVGTQHPPALPWAVALLLELEKRNAPFGTRSAEALDWAIGSRRWEKREASGRAVLITAGPTRQPWQRLVCIDEGANDLLRYPVCTWLLE